MSIAVRDVAVPVRSLPRADVADAAGRHRQETPVARARPLVPNPSAGAVAASTTTPSSSAGAPPPPAGRPHRPRRAGRHRHRRPARGRPLVHMGRRRARPASPSAVGDHRTRRGGHRAGRDQDRQGGRRPPGRALGAGHRAARRCWRPSATAPPSTGCSTATPATWRGAGCAAPGRPGRWPPGPAFGRDLLSGQWASAEFAALSGLWSDGVAVPYPVQLSGTELLLEFVGDPDGQAAPRLAQLRPDAGPAARAVAAADRGAARAGRPRPHPRRPVGLQPAGARRAAGHDRPAAGGGRGRQPAGPAVPGPRRARGSPTGSPPAGCRPRWAGPSRCWPSCGSRWAWAAVRRPRGEPNPR